MAVCAPLFFSTVTTFFRTQYYI